MFAQTRDQVRTHFIEVRQKMTRGDVLEPMQQMLAAVIEQHPEYHPLLDRPDYAFAADFAVDDLNSNPFLHMSLHIAVREQLQTDRPSGVVDAYAALLSRRNHDAHASEHAMMECLSAQLRATQSSGVAPSEVAYLSCVRQI